MPGVLCTGAVGTLKDQTSWFVLPIKRFSYVPAGQVTPAPDEHNGLTCGEFFVFFQYNKILPATIH